MGVGERIAKSSKRCPRNGWYVQYNARSANAGARARRKPLITQLTVTSRRHYSLHSALTIRYKYRERVGESGGPAVYNNVSGPRPPDSSVLQQTRLLSLSLTHSDSDDDRNNDPFSSTYNTTCTPFRPVHCHTVNGIALWLSFFTGRWLPRAIRT